MCPSIRQVCADDDTNTHQLHATFVIQSAVTLSCRMIRCMLPFQRSDEIDRIIQDMLHVNALCVSVARESSFVSQSSRRSSGFGGPDEAPTVDPRDEDTKRKVDDWQGMSLPSLAESPLNDLRVSKAEPKPVFVEVQNLTKGQIFVSDCA